MQITTVTQKGQITLTAEIRKRKGIKPGDKVQVSEEKGEIKVEPIPDFFSLRGSLKAKARRIPLQKLIRMEEEAAEKEAVREYLLRAKRMKK